MSNYQIHKFCRCILHDLSFRNLAIHEPETALKQFDLTGDEKSALLSGDVRTLFEQGASGFLLLILSRFEIFGLKLALYNARMLEVPKR
jgi:hypothetical protein